MPASHSTAVKSIDCISSPQHFWHQGPVLWKRKFPRTRVGRVVLGCQVFYICGALLFLLLLHHLHFRSLGIRSQRLGTPGLDNSRQVAIFLLPPTFLDWEPGPSCLSILTPTLPSKFMGTAGEISLLQVGQSSRKIFFFPKETFDHSFVVLSFIQNIM